MSLDISMRFDGPAKASTIVALAHGAGAGMDSPFMQFMAKGLADAGYRVARFNFPYMASKLTTGKSKPPDREPILRATWLQVVDTVRKAKAKRLFIGGKSMGGRIASMIADETNANGLICLGYPFHPVGKPEKLRTKHLETLATPTLIVQGERDALGTRQEAEGYKLSTAIKFAWMPDGDHSFKPRKSSGNTEEQNLHSALERITAFVSKLGVAL